MWDLMSLIWVFFLSIKCNSIFLTDSSIETELDERNAFKISQLYPPKIKIENLYIARDILFEWNNSESTGCFLDFSVILNLPNS